MDRIDKFLDDLEKTFAHIREREGSDSVCGLCEYDGAYIGESGDWCNECPGFNKDDCFKLSDKTRKKWTEEILAICKHFRNDSEIPNSSDVISRRQAIDAVDAIGHIATMSDGDKCIRRSAVKYTLSALPSAQPEQRWIPCSERLPEESGYYIITAHDGVGHRTTFVKYQKKAKSWGLTGARSYWRVIAWMPLPEPYQEGEQE